MSVKKRVKAIDRFIAGCKTDGIYDDLNAACIMAGWDGLAGALTPLVGAAPTNIGFLDADLDRGIGLKGNGSSKYLDSNRANNVDVQNDSHNSVYVSSPNTSGIGGYAGADEGDSGCNRIIVNTSTGFLFTKNRASSGYSGESQASLAGFVGTSRDDSSSFFTRADSANVETEESSGAPASENLHIFNRSPGFSNYTDATLSFYSIGSSLGSDPATGLAALDARVSTLMADLRAIEESDFDADALTYIRAVEAADGAYLETDVKVAINKLVVGLKFDSLWDSIGTSCLLCGPRTIAGALVPLRGDAPTPYGFVSGDYSRTGGLGDPDAASYLDSNASAGAYDDENHHWSVYFTSGSSLANRAHFGYITNTLTGQPDYSFSFLFTDSTNNMIAFYLGTTTFYGGAGAATGLAGISANNNGTFTSRINGINKQSAATSQTLYPANYYVFARNNVPGASSITDDTTIAFYSIGTSLDLSKLDSHISSYVTAIGAAL
jgi:hypothetical protein